MFRIGKCCYCTLAIAVFVAPIFSAAAQSPIPISNHSFELPAVTTGQHSGGFATPINDWSTSAGGNVGVFIGGEFGQAATATDGTQIAFLNETTGQIFRTLPTTYHSGQNYSLMFDVSARSPQLSDDAAAVAFYEGVIANFGGLNAGNTVRTRNISPAGGVLNDSFRTFVVSASAAQIAAASADGQQIGIGFFGNGGAVTGTSDYDLDNIRLTAVGVLTLLDNPTIVNHGSEHNANYAAENVFDLDFSGTSNGSGSEYSSASSGTSFIDFDFGASTSVYGFDFAQRGNDNDTLFGMSLTFSLDSTFGNADDETLYLLPTDFNEGNTTQFERFVFSEQIARYVRWEAGAGQSAFRGAAEMAFLTTIVTPTVVPEPSSIAAMCLVMLVGMGCWVRCDRPRA